MKADISVDVVYPHPIEQVWRALTTSEGLAAWLMPNDFEPIVGHHFTLRTRPVFGFDGVVHCQVLELQPPTRMVWSWSGGKIDTTVTFTLAEVDGTRTRFRMRQIGFHGLPGRLTRLVLEGGGDRVYGRRLPAYLDHLAGGRAVSMEAPCAEGRRTAVRSVFRSLHRPLRKGHPTGAFPAEREAE